MFKDLYIKNIEEFKVGDMICAQHNAKGWYRCEIKGIIQLNNNEGDYEIDVYYVDFGDSAYIRLNEARMLLEQFNKLPCYAIQCTLNGIEPLNSDGWTVEAVDKFEDLVYSCQWVKLNAYVIGCKEAPKIPIISLHDPIKVNDYKSKFLSKKKKFFFFYKSVDIAKMLIDDGLAVESNVVTKSF